MTERSYFWDDTTIGDASLAPYDIDVFHDLIWRLLYSGNQANSGVIANAENELRVTNEGSVAIVNTGVALIYGGMYENTAKVNVEIPIPIASTRHDYIVVRRNWITQTAIIKRIAGTEGAGRPSLVQVASSTWDVPLAIVVITTAGVITVIDQRVYAKSPILNQGSLEQGEMQMPTSGKVLAIPLTNWDAKDQKGILYIGIARVIEPFTLTTVQLIHTINDEVYKNQAQLLRGANAVVTAIGTGKAWLTAPTDNGSANYASAIIGYFAQSHNPHFAKTAFIKTISIPNDTVALFDLEMIGVIYYEDIEVNIDLVGPSVNVDERYWPNEFEEGSAFDALLYGKQ